MHILFLGEGHKISFSGTDVVIMVHVKHSIPSGMLSSIIVTLRETSVTFRAKLGEGCIGKDTVVSLNVKSSSLQRKSGEM